MHTYSERCFKDQYSYTRTVLCLHLRCVIAVSLASGLWLVASGHEPPYFAAAMNKVNGSIDNNGDRPGYTSGSFSTPTLEVQVCH